MIQLRQQANPETVEFAGRVEHVDSGRTDHFGSIDELVRFMERTIIEVEAEAAKKSTP